MIHSSSGISSSTWLRMSSVSREMPKVPIPTPCRCSARRISSSVTRWFPSTVKSQMKKEPKNSSALHRVSPANSACRRRNRPRKKGTPSFRTTVSRQSSCFTARRRA